MAPVDPKRRQLEVYSNHIADAMDAELQPLATSGLVRRISKYDTYPANHPHSPNCPRAGQPLREGELNARFWPIATEGHVRRNIGDQGKSGLVVLNVSFVARDPDLTIRLTNAIAADKFSTGIVAGTSPRANCRHTSFCSQAAGAIKKNLKDSDMVIRAPAQQT